MSQEITLHLEVLRKMIDKLDNYGCIGLIIEENDDCCFTDFPIVCPLKEECMAIASQLRNRKKRNDT